MKGEVLLLCLSSIRNIVAETKHSYGNL
jgi:hypothetical protein